MTCIKTGTGMVSGTVSTYCSYLVARAKALGQTEDLPKVSRSLMMCSACNVRLCRAHFNVYHGWELGGIVEI